MTVKAVVWHHSATQDGEAKDWAAILAYHTSFRVDGKSVSEVEYEARLVQGLGTKFERPWSDIGYHFGIERVGGGSPIVIQGRPVTKEGAHCKGMNGKALGVCVVGNFDLEPPDHDQLTAAVLLAQRLNAQFNLGPVNHHYHRQFADKTCPGSKFPQLKEFRRLIGGT